MTEPFLVARNIAKRFGALTALANVDLDIRSGEVLALLGDNGAGKSSVIRSLALIFSGGSSSIGATRQNWQTWLRSGEQGGSVEATVHRDVVLDTYLKTAREFASMTVRAELSRTSDPIVQDAVTLSFAGSTLPANRSLWSNAGG